MSGTKNLNSSGSLESWSTAAGMKLRPAGFRRRALASLIDSALLFLVGEVFDLAFGYSATTFFKASATFVLYGNWIISLVISFLFYGYCLSRMGSTPGKAVLRLRVVDSTNGTSLSFLRGGLRCAVGYWISLLPLAMGYAMVVFRSDKKALHDLIFNSHVWYQDK